VTVVPTATPPLIPFPEGTVAQAFTIYYRQGDAIYSLSSVEGATPQLFLDPLAEFGHMLPPSARLVSDWGAFSPDGQSLALVLTDDPVVYAIPNTDSIFWPAPHPTDLYLFDVAGRTLRLLAPDGFLPVWSPDSQRLAYRSTETFGLWVVDAAGGAAKEVHAVPPHADGDGADPTTAVWFNWAYDSRRLALLESNYYDTHQWLIVDTGGLEAPRPVDEEFWRPISLMQWSPRDDRLAFLLPGAAQQSLTDVWLMNGDQTGWVQLTHDLSFPFDVPLWSPDGRWIAITGMASYEAEHAWYDLWLIEPDSAAVHRLTYETPPASRDEFDDADNDILLLWSPDGTQLVFFKGSQQLWLMSLIDGSRRQLIQSEEILYDSGIIVGP
jgi:Tol biopolymer transport system component